MLGWSENWQSLGVYYSPLKY